MGIIPDPTVPTANHCAPCWPAGNAPLVLKAFFSSIEGAQLSAGAGVGYANAYYDVAAELGNPCYWRTYPPQDIICRVKLGSPSANVRLAKTGVGSLFFSWDFPACTRWFENKNIATGKLGWKGYCYICSSMELTNLYAEIMSEGIYETRYELFPMADYHVALRVARIADGTHMTFKVDVS